jgi:hypothetical protein
LPHAYSSLDSVRTYPVLNAMDLAGADVPGLRAVVEREELEPPIAVVDALCGAVLRVENLRFASGAAANSQSRREPRLDVSEHAGGGEAEGCGTGEIHCRQGVEETNEIVTAAH